MSVITEFLPVPRLPDFRYAYRKSGTSTGNPVGSPKIESPFPGEKRKFAAVNLAEPKDSRWKVLILGLVTFGLCSGILCADSPKAGVPIISQFSTGELGAGEMSWS